MHKIPFNTVYIAGAASFTANEFFCGKPGKYCVVTSTLATNATVTISEGFEKFARWVKPSLITVTFSASNQRGQVRILGSLGNRDRTNIGFTYFDVAPYGTSKGEPIIYQNTLSFGILDNPADPNFF